jgi:arylsulfatase A-like enzyme
MPRPNILIFMTDHQRGDTALPEHPALTPNLTRLAGEGVTFTETFCPTPHCCPARATFWSGLYPSRHGVWNNVCNGQRLSRGLNDGVRLWSEDLADAGYAMHWFGKWHVSAEESPRDRGWTEHSVTAGPGAHHGVDWDRFRQIARQPDPAERGDGQILRPGYWTHQTYGTYPADERHNDEAIAEDAAELIPALADGDEPWCMFVGAIGPHDPYVVPQRFLDLYDVDDIPLPASYADDLSDKPVIYQRMREQIFGQLSEREVRQAIRHFWAYCSWLDEMFGRVLTALDESGQAENTVVLYTSDHGDYCGEHGLFAKGIPCFRGAYDVPAVMRWPAGIDQPGRPVDALVSGADFGPTFLDLAGLSPDRHFTGASLAPFLNGQTPAEWREAIFTQCDGVELYYTQRSVRTANWHYTFNGFDRDELYDLQADPHQMRNLAADPRHREVVRDMCGRMWRFARDEEDTAINPYITVGLAPFGPAEAFRST